MFQVQRNPLISTRIWRATSAALLDPKIEPPIWFDFLLDGEHRIAIGDLHAGIVNLAIACESLFRALLARYLRERDDAIINLMNQINISRIMDKWKHLNRVGRWAQRVDMPKIKQLFDLRNAIAHRGQVRNLDAAECSELAKAVHLFVLIADKQAR